MHFGCQQGAILFDEVAGKNGIQTFVIVGLKVDEKAEPTTVDSQQGDASVDDQATCVQQSAVAPNGDDQVGSVDQFWRHCQMTARRSFRFADDGRVQSDLDATLQ